MSAITLNCQVYAAWPIRVRFHCSLEATDTRVNLCVNTSAVGERAGGAFRSCLRHGPSLLPYPFMENHGKVVSYLHPVYPMGYTAASVRSFPLVSVSSSLLNHAPAMRVA